MARLKDSEPDDGFKKVKARKSHKCDNCHKEAINPGDYYMYGEWRGPRYDDHYYDGEQVGIHYAKYRICLPCDAILTDEDASLEDDLNDYLECHNSPEFAIHIK